METFRKTLQIADVPSEVRHDCHKFDGHAGCGPRRHTAPDGLRNGLLLTTTTMIDCSVIYIYIHTYIHIANHYDTVLLSINTSTFPFLGKVGGLESVAQDLRYIPLMIQILHYLKDPKLWKLWYVTCYE